MFFFLTLQNSFLKSLRACFMKSIFSSNGISVSVDHHLLRKHGFMSGQKSSQRRVWDKEKVASSSTFYNNPSSVKVASLLLTNEEDENGDEN